MKIAIYTIMIIILAVSTTAISIEAIKRITVTNIPVNQYLYVICETTYKSAISSTIYFSSTQCKNGDVVRVSTFSDPITPLKQCIVSNNRCELK